MFPVSYKWQMFLSQSGGVCVPWMDLYCDNDFLIVVII